MFDIATNISNYEYEAKTFFFSVKNYLKYWSVKWKEPGIFHGAVCNLILIKSKA